MPLLAAYEFFGLSKGTLKFSMEGSLEYGDELSFRLSSLSHSKSNEYSSRFSTDFKADVLVLGLEHLVGEIKRRLTLRRSVQLDSLSTHDHEYKDPMQLSELSTLGSGVQTPKLIVEAGEVSTSDNVELLRRRFRKIEGVF